VYSNIINLFTDSGNAERFEKSGSDNRGCRSDLVRRYTIKATFITVVVYTDPNTYVRNITYIGSLSWNTHFQVEFRITLQLAYNHICIPLVVTGYIELLANGQNRPKHLGDPIN
jgi:hypothetical protein